MIQEKIKQLTKVKFWWLIFLIFGIIFASRLLFLNADLPSTHVEIEEKLAGYNARNKVFLNRWALYNNWYQPMIYGPIQSFFSYLSFSLLGVGLAQFRLPMVLCSLVGSVFFYLILLKRTNRTFALLGVILYAFNFEMTVWNRSGLTENLYLLFMPLSVYFLAKENLKAKDVFFAIFFSALGVVAKLDGYPFLLSMILFLFFRSIKTKTLLKNIKPIILGPMVAIATLLILFTFFHAFKYVLPMYRFYFEIIVKQGDLLKEILATFTKFIYILLSIDPYIILVFLLSLPVLIINRGKLDKTDWFMIVFLLISVLTRLQIPTAYMYFKRVIFLYFPIYYIISKSLFFLWKKEDCQSENIMKPREFWIYLFIYSLYSSAIIFFFLYFFNKSIPRLYGFLGFSESFHYNAISFAYLFIVIITAICCFNGMLLLRQFQGLRKTLLSLILFLVFISIITNGLYVLGIFLPKNIRYSYQKNNKLTELIPENQMIIGHEQAFRAFAYLSKHDFYFNHDGGANPIEYREVFERRDLRYFITNVEEFWNDKWGIPNKVRLELIKQAYPNLKLVDVFFASKIPLAIYDKYPDQK